MTSASDDEDPTYPIRLSQLPVLAARTSFDRDALPSSEGSDS